MLSSSHLEELDNLIRKVVPKDVRETQSFNEVGLEVQEGVSRSSIIGRATEEAFKLVWIKRPQLSV